MAPASLCWCLFTLACSSAWLRGHAAPAPENEVPLRPTTWLQEGKLTLITLPKGRTRRLHFTLGKKSAAVSVAVSPCGLAIEWSLSARSLKDTPFQMQWSTKKSSPQVWWRGPGTEEKIHSFRGGADHTYRGPAHSRASVYVLRLRSKLQSSRAAVYLHRAPGPPGASPPLPADGRVHTVGVGMSSVTLSWAPGAAQTGYEYCVLVNSRQNHPSLCAAVESARKEEGQRGGRRAKTEGAAVWPMAKERWRSEARSPPSAPSGESSDLHCACRGTETVCTVSELLPGTRYYFDVFAIDRLSGTSAAYMGASARTHQEAPAAAAAALREGELRWVTFTDSEQLFTFRPRGPRPSGLLTLQGCGGDQSLNVSVSGGGRLLSSQAVTADLAQVWLEGSPSYLIRLAREGSGRRRASPALPGELTASLKMQASSAHRRTGAPSLPATLRVRSFSRLRSCSSVTLAWMGTEERGLYCVYRRKVAEGALPAAPCLGPESRSDTERVLCKYFQELNPRRAVTTAVVGGLEPGVAYAFDVYLMRRWGIPVKYASKVVKTRKGC